MPDEKRKTYCRICGENKGHNFDACKNISGMRKIIRSQDEELGKALVRAGRAEQAERVSACNTQVRILNALLDLAEVRRPTVQTPVE